MGLFDCGNKFKHFIVLNFFIYDCSYNEKKKMAKSITFLASHSV